LTFDKKFVILRA